MIIPLQEKDHTFEDCINERCDDCPDDNQNEKNLIETNMKIESNKIKKNHFENICYKTNDQFPFLRKCSQNEISILPKMGDIKDSNVNDNVTSGNDTVYYAVHVPTEYSVQEMLFDKKHLHVYTNKEEVLKIMKNNKKARFKQFKSRKEAEEFALNGAEILSQDGSSAIADSEKIMPFKRPKTEEMIQFRKDIERGDLETVREKIFENPKYLVSNGDTPSILQEGSRYNALHIAAKARNAKIAHLILDTITRIDFISYLYDDNDVDSCVSRSEILLDRYLNTPDKGSNETPLHLASKHGAVEVVQVLLSYPQCQKDNVFNRYNELPKDIICNRVNGPCEKAKAAIVLMLEEQYFVPVLRSEDNSLQPRVGEAFSYSSPLKLKSDLLSPRLEIQAYAGPMSKAKAELFKKKWKNPLRSVRDKNSSFSVRLRDTEKGLEKIGRNLASELEVPWQEYWSFLDTFVDLSSEHGLELLEKYLKTRFNETLEPEAEVKVTYNTNSSEKSFCSISDLCETFELCGSQDKHLSPTSPAKRLTSTKCSFAQRENFNKKSVDTGKNYGNHPLVYVERSCEVFGKRIGTTISSCVLYENQPESLKECLETQVKHLLTLVKSYREDSRFQAINFQLIHSRVATIAIENLQDMTSRDRLALLTTLKEIDWSDGALSDDEDFNNSFKNHSNECSGIFTRQLRCLVKNLIEQLHCSQEVAPHISPSAREETDCLLYWAFATACTCTWGTSTTKRLRSGLKRKQCRNDCDCNCDVSPRKIHFEDEKVVKESSESQVALADYDDGDGNEDEDEDDDDDDDDDGEDPEDRFFTPPSGNSDAEDMEDTAEIPNTFIYPGPLPTKVDFAVLEAIENVPLVPEKYPNIYLWRHILQMHPRNLILDHQTCSPESFHRKTLAFESPKSSPRKLLDRSFGSCESPPAQTTVTEPWERVTGLYSPRRSMRSSLSILHFENSVMSR